ncbi:MAG: DNA repair protein RecN [Chitinophagaceae bacterium]
MLQQLIIQNYAIIDEIKINFSNKLNIITGETGAGKSILMGAVGLVLGNRADGSVLWKKDKKCIVEAEFVSKHPAVQNFLMEQELDLTSEISIRREISNTGKSRAFINDTPVNLAQLKTFASLLVDLHQQFDTLDIGDHDFQREVIDALANNGSELKNYRVIFSSYIKTKKELEEWKLQQANANKELDYNRFLFDELEEINFKENEIEELEKEIKLLSNAEEIKADLSRIISALEENETPIVAQVKSLHNQLQHLSTFHNSIQPLVERLHSAQVELQDISDELSRIGDSIHFDPKKLDQFNERMSSGYRLLKKHGVSTTFELLTIKKTLQKKLESVMNIGDNIARKEKEIEVLYADAVVVAKKISASRLNQVKPFEERVNELLKQVGMPNASIKVSMRETALATNGHEEVGFLFDANKTGRLEPLSKVASGGELSRLMLSIKSLVAKSVQLPTLIFDEIDTGISGEAAKQVGIIMQELSGRHQVIAITHQAQIAAKADAHYFVYKEPKGANITTGIRLLDTEERINIIAKMLGGEKPTNAAIENAREMVLA